MNDPFAAWPPIIHSAHRPRAILWRDALLTVLMWGMLFLILYSELAFAVSALQVLLRRSEAQVDAEIDLFLRQMRPLIQLVAALVLMLVIATFASRRRRAEALIAPQPLPLSEAEIATIAGLNEAELATARTIRRAIAFRQEGGLKVVEAPAMAVADKGNAGCNSTLTATDSAR